MRARLVLGCLLAVTPLFAVANVVLVVADGPGVGFNDPTPVAPVGGNSGTTVGAQRRNVFVRAAQIWGAELNSNVPIRIEASWPRLPCEEDFGALGAAGPTFIFADGPGLLSGYWYAGALAEKLTNTNLVGDEADIVAFFNPNLGRPGCLTGLFFYLGLDGKTPPGTVDLLETVLHEIGHGLGFSSFTDETTGRFCCGTAPLPSIYDRFLLDKSTGLHWDVMTNAQRKASAINNAGQLVWDGARVTSNVPDVLRPAPEVRVSAPSSAAITLIAGPAAFGPSLAAPVSGEIMLPAADGGLACNPLSGLDVLAVKGKIALVNRGECPFITKVKNAQDAGAIAVIVANNVPGRPPLNLNGIDPTITIPSVMIVRSDGNRLKSLLQFRSRTNSGVIVRLGQSPTRRAGADASNRMFIYAPNPVQPGSSISHWDVSPLPNLLMEPFDTVETSFSVKPPGDLTLPALQQLGW